MIDFVAQDDVEDGSCRFITRLRQLGADDMFKAAGYRIGPSEIENCLIKHPAVTNAAVVPKPDAERSNVIKALVVLVEGTGRGESEDAKLINALQQHVRGLLAPYEYPT